MTDLLPAYGPVREFLAWFFNNPATALSVVVVGWKLGRKIDTAALTQRLLIDALTIHTKAAGDAATRIEEAASRMEHAASTVVGTHKLTRAVIQRYLGEPAAPAEET